MANTSGAGRFRHLITHQRATDLTVHNPTFDQTLGQFWGQIITGPGNEEQIGNQTAALYTHEIRFRANVGTILTTDRLLFGSTYYEIVSATLEDARQIEWILKVKEAT